MKNRDENQGKHENQNKKFKVTAISNLIRTRNNSTITHFCFSRWHREALRVDWKDDDDAFFISPSIPEETVSSAVKFVFRFPNEQW